MRESLRYLDNAKAMLKSAPVEGRYYADVRPVRECFGAAYLAVLEAINEALAKKGYTKKEYPKSVDEYRKALQKHFAVHNGKIMREFEGLYDTLHIAGYYRGLIYNVQLANDSLEAARHFINKMK